jgi:signal transduction histidine kinase
MHISELIKQELISVVDEWVEMAPSKQPATYRLSNEELADHARVLLQAMAADVRTYQSTNAGHEKAEGNAPGNAPDITRIARDHAEQRFKQGFVLDDLLSEFRALRASITRRWAGQLEHTAGDAVNELSRFDEAMDQALAGSVSLYSTRVDDARNLLLGVIGHDLRTPLGVVSMTSDYLLKAGALGQGNSDALGRIFRAAERMKSIVDDILDFTRTALGVSLPVTLAPANMGDIVEQIASEVSAVYPGSQVEVSRDGELTGQWDAARVAQLLSNLIANAVQHGEDGKAVSVRVRGDRNEVVLRVHNDGPPIPEETMRTLFTPLRQTWSMEAEKHSGSSGLGLGLYIAREIAVAHGGSIDVSSDVRGTAFLVRLPTRPPTALTRTEHTHSAGPPAARSAGDA